MAQKTSARLKQNLLLLFVVLCVVIIGATWSQNINEPLEKTPTNYRGVPQAVGPTTAVTLAPDRAGGAGEEHMHKGEQQSSRTESATPTAPGEAAQDDSTETPEP